MTRPARLDVVCAAILGAVLGCSSGGSGGSSGSGSSERLRVEQRQREAEALMDKERQIADQKVKEISELKASSTG